MKKQFLIAAALLCAQALAASSSNAVTTATDAPSSPPPQQPAASAPQQQPTPQTPRPAPTPVPPSGLLALSDYGIEFAPDARLIVVMAALDAAGWDAGGEPTQFRQMVRRDYSKLDPALRARLRDFYTRYQLPGTRTPAEQAARYVSLAYTLGPAPGLEAPPRSEDLPAGVLDVLDFAPLAREFYRSTGMDERLPEYLRAHRAEADQLRLPTSRMVRDVLSYLHIQPATTTVERVNATDPSRPDAKKRDAQKRVTVLREKPRRFLVVPDLLAAPGAVNFRVIGDDYYAIIPPGTDPAASELRRAYIQYLVDPLVIRFNRAIAARRAEIKQLLDEQVAKGSAEASADVFLIVARSLVVAADARLSEAVRLNDLQNDASARIREAKTEEARAAVIRETRETRARIEDATTAQLAEAYERGAVLAFFFAEQLRGLETSGFDISNFFSDMVASFQVTRESRRPAEYAAAVKRYRDARALARASAEASSAAAAEAAPQTEQRKALLKGLEEVEQLVRLKNYEEADARLRAMTGEFRGEPRVFYALGQVASVSAQDAFDENLQVERLTRALSFYRQAIMAASRDTDGALISRAHAATGRILVFLERKEEALKEFDAAIALGEVEGGAYREALEQKRRLTGQP